MAEAEKRMIFQALKKCDNNITQAAQALGISRRTIHRKLKQYQIDKETPATDNDQA
jgi:transcriptional regulator of acetoin/glycerol metabolism